MFEFWILNCEQELFEINFLEIFSVKFYLSLVNIFVLGMDRYPVQALSPLVYNISEGYCFNFYLYNNDKGWYSKSPTRQNFQNIIASESSIILDQS